MGCIVHGVAKSQTRLSDFTFTFHFLSSVGHCTNFLAQFLCASAPDMLSTEVTHLLTFILSARLSRNMDMTLGAPAGVLVWRSADNTL